MIHAAQCGLAQWECIALDQCNCLMLSPVSTGMRDHSRFRVSFAPSSYLINHSGELSLAIPPGEVKSVLAKAGE